MTIGIIIGGILLGIISGGWCGILFTKIDENTPKNKKIKIIIVSIIIFSCLWITEIYDYEDIQKQAQPQTHCHCEYCTGMRD